MLGTLEKAGQVLDLYSDEQPEWGVTEVATALGIPKPSAHHLLASLAEIGLLQRTTNRHYRLGYRALALSRIVLQTTPWRDSAEQILHDLVREFGETVQLAALDGKRLVCVARVGGTQPESVQIAEVGSSIPPHCSSNGKILLAFSSTERTMQVLENQHLNRFTENTIVTHDELASELERVRAQGFAYDVGEYRHDACSVAAPIRNHLGDVVASLSLAAPAPRFYARKAAYRTAVIRVTERLSIRIGYNPSLFT
ncbi:IclR family transcriptional regulator [Deinococcus sp. YIM 77859]|uniref:IclR family transcriptional regulator n=1 Tax=Deinococcus sp. YIM 77859 TaxID=1540221 RepID=UPI0005569829|nr:IclR family transcriptional regulator [Deinococcus sp. YIM 77859]